MSKFSDKTLAAIVKLTATVDGVWSIMVVPADKHTPKGHEQDCDAGVEGIKTEWVNQTTNGGFTGDDFHGTVTWRLGGFYVVASY